jgi:chorismate mutase
VSDVLAETRARLDAVDDAIVSLLAERAALVASLARWKASRGLPFRDLPREEAALARIAEVAAAQGLDPAAARAVFATLVGRRLERDDGSGG